MQGTKEEWAEYMRKYRAARPGDRNGEGVQYRRRHLQRARDLHVIQKTSAKKRNRAYMNEYKEIHPCVDCGHSDIRQLHFDHRPGTEKTTCVSMMVRHGWSLKAIQAEINKCDVRCSSCHLKRHWADHDFRENQIAAHTKKK